MNHVIKNEFYTLSVNELGAEMTSLVFSGKEMLWNTKFPECWSDHAPLLFPVCGRLKDSKYTYGGKEYPMAGHGFIKKMTFALKSKSESALELEFKSNDETRAIYPFDFIFTAKYELIGKNVMFSVTIENTDDKTLPYMFGWHPGFNLFTDEGQDIEDYVLDFGKIENIKWIPLQHEVFASENRYDFPLDQGRYKLSEKQIYENDTLIFEEHHNKVALYADGHPFRLDMTWSDNLPSLCIWKHPDNGAKFLCIEPWSGTPNNGEVAENFEVRKMARLEPGNKDVYTYTMSFNA